MSENWNAFKALSIVFLLLWTGIAFANTEQGKTLEGQILDAEALVPIEGAQLLLRSSEQEILRSDLSTADGTFSASATLDQTYEVAVQVGDTIYTVGHPIQVTEETPFLRIAIPLAPATLQDGDESDFEDEEGFVTKGRTSAWSNPGTAALIVVAGAFVVGWVVDSLSDDDDPASASEPATLLPSVFTGRFL